MTQNRISVSEALKRIEAGLTVSDVTIDFERIKVEALDVMKLAKAGIEVPEEVIYYEDNDIVEEESSEEWEPIDYDPTTASESNTEVKIYLKKDIQQWVEAKNIQLDKLIENLLEEFYQSQKWVKED
jgi:uncharacterized protein (DUF433 family)